MKCCIAYASTHHGNTKKVVDAIAKEFDVDVIDVTATKLVAGIYVNSVDIREIQDKLKVLFSGDYKAFDYDDPQSAT